MCSSEEIQPWEQERGSGGDFARRGGCVLRRRGSLGSARGLQSRADMKCVFGRDDLARGAQPGGSSIAAAAAEEKGAAKQLQRMSHRQGKVEKKKKA